MKPAISIIIPARNEATSIVALLQGIQNLKLAAEIIVVDDGSSDQTAQLAAAQGAHVIRHPYGMGNGAAIKSGARIAQGETLVFLDADGQHPAEAIPHLLARLDQGYCMVVGARHYRAHAGLARAAANLFYNRFASWMVGHPIADLTSGLRAVRADLFRRFLNLLPNGFSYPTTITMCFFRCGLPVAYVPIEVAARSAQGAKSHIRPMRDGLRFLMIIFKVGAYFSPLKIFLPTSLLLLLSGLGYYAYTFFTMHRLTNMTAILLINALLVLLIGLVSEQITSLMFQSLASEHSPTASTSKDPVVHRANGAS